MIKCECGARALYLEGSEWKCRKCIEERRTRLARSYAV